MEKFVHGNEGVPGRKDIVSDDFDLDGCDVAGFVNRFAGIDF